MEGGFTLDDIKELQNNKYGLQKFLEKSGIDLKDNFDLTKIDFDNMSLYEIQNILEEMFAYFQKIFGESYVSFAMIMKAVSSFEEKEYINSLNEKLNNINCDELYEIDKEFNYKVVSHTFNKGKEENQLLGFLDIIVDLIAGKEDIKIMDEYLYDKLKTQPNYRKRIYFDDSIDLISNEIENNPLLFVKYIKDKLKERSIDVSIVDRTGSGSTMILLIKFPDGEELRYNLGNFKFE